MKRNLSSHVRPLLAVAVMAVFGVAAAQTTGSGMGATGSPGNTTPKMGTTGTTPGTMDNRSGTDTSVGSGTNSVGSGVGSNAGATSPANTFRSLDTANRGYLQRSDVTSVQGFSFDQADMNHDGRISQDEFAHWQSQNGRAGGAMGQGSGSMSNSGMTNRPGATGSYPGSSNSGTTSGQGTTGGSSGPTR
jgi:hypothetical protein